MSIGFQTFIEGTRFDVLNSMGYNFVVDVVLISGNGSKTYSYPGFTISAFLIGGTQYSGGSQTKAEVTVSGSTVSWTLNGSVNMVVVATPNSTVSYFGFTLNDYSVSPPKFKIAPNFVPYSLTQVITLTPSFGQVYQTRVPATMPMLAFHRSMASSGFDHVMWDEIKQNGYWALRFRGAGGTPMTSCRIYIFSKQLVNIPNFGFFLYNNGQLVWHSNCLPLNVISGSISGSSTPVAITTGISVVVYYPNDPAFPQYGTIRYNCYSAGIQSNGKWAANGSDIYNSVQGSMMPAFNMGPPAYIHTSIYDQYFSAALG